MFYLHGMSLYTGLGTALRQKPTGDRTQYLSVPATVSQEGGATVWPHWKVAGVGVSPSKTPNPAAAAHQLAVVWPVYVRENV